MFPAWMMEKLQWVHCPECRTHLTYHFIEFVGVRAPKRTEVSEGEPIVLISLLCPICGQRTNILHRQTLTEAINGVTAYVRWIEKCDGKMPPYELADLAQRPKPPSEPAPDPMVAPDAAERAAEPSNVRPRPSLRENQPDTPPTEREIQHFLHRLRKTSFKRSSKGFKDWMDDMRGAGSDGSGTSDAEKV